MVKWWWIDRAVTGSPVQEKVYFKMLRNQPMRSSDSRVRQTIKLEEQGFSGEERELEVLESL